MSIYEASITNPKKQLEFYKDLSEQLQRENKKIKKQLEEINKMIEKCGFVNIEQVMLSYCGLIAQQKEFIRYLEDTIQKEQKNLDDLCDIYKVPKENNSTYKFLCSFVHRIEEILSKYKEIIGDK